MGLEVSTLLHLDVLEFSHAFFLLDEMQCSDSEKYILFFSCNSYMNLIVSKLCELCFVQEIPLSILMSGQMIVLSSHFRRCVSCIASSAEYSFVDQSLSSLAAGHNWTTQLSAALWRLRNCLQKICRTIKKFPVIFNWVSLSTCHTED